MSNLNHKYPISSWILSSEHLAEGEWVAYEDEYGNEIKAEYMGKLDDSNEIIVVLPEGREVVDMLSIYDTIVYRIGKVSNKKCSCGARYTSNPKHHLSYCDLYSKSY